MCWCADVNLRASSPSVAAKSCCCFSFKSCFPVQVMPQNDISSDFRKFNVLVAAHNLLAVWRCELLSSQAMLSFCVAQSHATLECSLVSDVSELSLCAPVWRVCKLTFECVCTLYWAITKRSFFSLLCRSRTQRSGCGLQKGLTILLDDSAEVFKCHQNQESARVKADIASSLLILDAGYNIASLQLKYRGVDFRDPKNWGCNGGYFPSSIQSDIVNHSIHTGIVFTNHTVSFFPLHECFL